MTSLTFEMKCVHEFTTDYGIRIVFPDDFIVIERSSCTFEGYESRYYCKTIADDNTIEASEFLADGDDIAADGEITFTIDSVIMPSNFD